MRLCFTTVLAGCPPHYICNLMVSKVVKPKWLQVSAIYFQGSECVQPCQTYIYICICLTTMINLFFAIIYIYTHIYIYIYIVILNCSNPIIDHYHSSLFHMRYPIVPFSNSIQRQVEAAKGGRLYISDTGNHRMQRWDPGAKVGCRFSRVPCSCDEVGVSQVKWNQMAN